MIYNGLLGKKVSYLCECFGYHLIASIHSIAKEMVTCVNTQIDSGYFLQIIRQEKFRQTKKHFLLPKNALAIFLISLFYLIPGGKTNLTRFSSKVITFSSLQHLLLKTDFCTLMPNNLKLPKFSQIYSHSGFFSLKKLT